MSLAFSPHHPIGIWLARSLVNPWWNPAVEDQATDGLTRITYRIVQDKPAFVDRHIVDKAVKVKMLQMQDKKRALANTVYDQTGKLEYAFSEADLVELLG